MARFFFQIQSGSEQVSDDEGSECADVHEACKEAVAGMAEMAAQQLRDGTEQIKESITVVDEAGAPVLSVTIEATIHVER